MGINYEEKKKRMERKYFSGQREGGRGGFLPLGVCAFSKSRSGSSTCKKSFVSYLTTRRKGNLADKTEKCRPTNSTTGEKTKCS